MRDQMAKLSVALSSGSNLLTVAVVLGVVTALLTLLFLGGDDDTPAGVQPPSALETLREAGDPVVVTRDLIPSGTELVATMLEVIEVQKDAAPDGAFSEVEGAVGRVTRLPLARGEPVLASKLVGADAETREGLAYSIPRGTRAVAVGFSEVLGAGGLLVPGDHVDVLISTNIASMYGPGEVLPEDEDPNHPLVFTLLQDVLVLAIGQTFTEPPSPPYPGQVPTTQRLDDPQVEDAGTITLAVTAEQAQILFLAAERGKLGFALRPFGAPALDEVLTPAYKLTPGLLSSAGTAAPTPTESAR